MIQKRHIGEVAAGQKRGEDAADHGTKIDRGTGTGGAGRGKERTVQETAEEIEVDPRKEEGSVAISKTIRNQLFMSIRDRDRDRRRSRSRERK